MNIFLIVLFIINPIISILGSLVEIFLRGLKRYQVILFSIFFFLLGYYYAPTNINSDLSRYFNILASFSNQELSSIILNDYTNSVPNTFFWLISKTNNYQLLPAIVAFLVYGTTFLIIYDYVKLNNINKKEQLKIILMAILLIPFPIVVNNVRNVMSFSFFALYMYMSSVRKKRYSPYIFLILSLLTHQSAIILVLIRLSSAIVYKLVYESSILIKLIYMGVSLLFGAFIMAVLFGKVPILAELSEDVLEYTTGNINNGSAYIEYLSNSLFMKIVKLYFTLLAVYFLFSKKLYSEKNTFNIFFILTNGVILLCFPITLPVYLRFYFVVMLLYPVVLLRNNKKLSFSMNSLFIVIFLAIGIVIQFGYIYLNTNWQYFLTDIIVGPWGKIFLESNFIWR